MRRGKEIDLYTGLYIIKSNPKAKLYSDGLHPGEYICYVEGLGVCHSDGTVIGKDEMEAVVMLSSFKWVNTNKFYLYVEGGN